jgi:hypothetical protein
MFKIEKNVPLPVAYIDGGFRKYPFGDLQVGDSFEFPKEQYERITKAASSFGIRNGSKFSVSSKKFRVWRVE